MDKVTVLIIEDSPAESDALIEVLLANNYHVVGVATTRNEGLALLQAHKVDIIVIDIFLHGKPDGILFASTVSATTSIPFVFLSSSKDRQIFERAHLTHPYSFLLKPFNELEILYAIEIALEKCYGQQQVFSSGRQDTVISKEYLFIKKKDALKKVNLAELVYIEVDDRYCHVVTDREKFTIQISLTRIMELLPAETFSQTHRNFIVNLTKITEIIPADNLILLTGNHQAAYSDKYKNFMNNYRILK